MAEEVETSREASIRRAGEADREIGLRLRALRIAVGLTQAALADAAGLTFQQIQKYETGKSRLAASMLCRFAEILGAPPGALLPHAGADQWGMLGNNPRLTRLLHRLQAMPSAELEAVLDRMEAEMDLGSDAATA